MVILAYGWCDPLGVFSCKSCLTCFASFHIANFQWKLKVPVKAKAFVWEEINTNDMSQSGRMAVASSLDMCILCRVNCETCSHLFLHHSSFVGNLLAFEHLWGYFGMLFFCFGVDVVGVWRRKEKMSWQRLLIWQFCGISG